MNSLPRRVASALIRYFPLVVVVLFVLSFFTAKLALSVWQGPARQMDQAVIFTVQSGDRFAHVAVELEQQGVWSSANLIRLLQLFLAPEFILKAGEYRLPEQASPVQIITILDQGVSIQESITFIEGENYRQMMQRLGDHKGFLPLIKDQSDPAFFAAQRLDLSSFAIDMMSKQLSYEVGICPILIFMISIGLHSCS